ncbi:MAG: hypothetical protein K2L17_03240 [Muribaculaceae bacterium]|nr:hypothetical protein [Muribaculaceae bacterium]
MKNKLFLMVISILLTTGVYARDLNRGYRGFVEWDNAIGNTDYRKKGVGQYGNGTLWFLGISTSHGYQFNNHWFLGAGAMISCGFPKNDKVIPGFAEVRYDTNLGKFTPFADLRAGYYFDGLSEGGLYLSPTIGYTFRTTKNLNFNFGIGMTLKSFTKHIYTHTGNNPGLINTEINYYPLLAVRIGIEFQ